MSNSVATARIPLCEPALLGNEALYVNECITTNWVSSVGRYVDLFEQQFAAFLGVPHAVAMCNGTAALHVALRLLDLGPGDEVIVPALCFIAASNAVAYTGATPVFVDVDSGDWNIDPAQVAARISARTRAILPVHSFGTPADMAPILATAQRHGIPVIEDACESLGARYHGQPVGTLGRMGCFSFNGNKLITTGGGGMLVTPDAALARRARFLSTQARSDNREYIHSEVGYNYRLTNVQSAMGVAQLEQIDSFLERKKAIAQRYYERLHTLPGLTPMPRPQGADNAFWLYSILISEEVGGARPLIQRLDQRGIQARPFFAPAHRLPMYATTMNPHDYPVAERLYQEGINLPSSVTLSLEQQERTIETIEDYLVATS